MSIKYYFGLTWEYSTWQLQCLFSLTLEFLNIPCCRILFLLSYSSWSFKAFHGLTFPYFLLMYLACYIPAYDFTPPAPPSSDLPSPHCLLCLKSLLEYQRNFSSLTSIKSFLKVQHFCEGFISSLNNYNCIIMLTWFNCQGFPFQGILGVVSLWSSQKVCLLKEQNPYNMPLWTQKKICLII